MAEGIPRRVGKYDVDAMVGHGGMGVVYKGHDTLGRQVAIKMVLASIVGESELIKRFHREAQLTANLHHPNIVTVYDWGQEGDSPFIVMEYLDGKSLDRWQIDGPPPMVLLKKLNIIEQVCAGLNYAHHRKIVHRDIKPANIFIQNDESVKLLDFGVARLAESADHAMTRTGQVLGSLSYMSPEQANGLRLDHRTDIFSAGVVLYQLLAGVLPFAGRDTASTLIRIMTASPEPLSKHLSNCPQGLDEVVIRALEKAPRDRYQTAEELALELSLVQTQLRRQIAGEYLASAETAIERSDWSAAKEILVELLKLDREHSRGLDLLREVQQIVRRQERASEASELKARAAEAREKRQFREALDFAEEAASLDNSNYDLVVFRDEIRTALERSEKARLAIERAETSLHAQQLEAAQGAVNEALSFDPANTTAQQLQTRITQALAERFKRAQAQSLLGQARNELTERRFASALVTLRKVESLDGSAPDLRSLLQQADQGQESERCEREFAGIADEIRGLIAKSDLNRAAARLASAEERFQGEPRLAELGRQLSDLRDKEGTRLALQRVENTDDVRRHDTQEAGNFAALDSSNAHARQIQTRIQQAQGEETKRSQEQLLLGPARREMAQGNWADAVALLKKVERLNADAPDLKALLQQAEAAQRRESQHRDANVTVRNGRPDFIETRVEDHERSTPTLVCEATDQESRAAAAAQRAATTLDVLPASAEGNLAQSHKRLSHRWQVWASLGVVVLGGPLLLVKFRAPAPAPAGNSVDVSIVTAPEGASIHVAGNGQSLDCVTPKCALQLPPGQYSLSATLTGYLTAAQNANFVPGMGPVQIQLTPKPLSAPAGTAEAALVVDTPGVQDAMVYVDGAAYATSGSELRLRGALNQVYRVRVEKEGYEPSPEQTVMLAHPTENLVVQMKQSANAATLVLHSATPRADVLVDGKAVGTIDAGGAFETTVPPGMHSVQLSSGRTSSNALSRQFNPRARVEISTLTIPVQPAPPPPQPQPVPPPPAPAVDTAEKEWDALKSTTDGNQLMAFLQRHPSGPYADKARARMEELDWIQTSASNDRGRLQAYLQRHSSGGHSQQAREQLEQLDWDAAKNSGDEQRLQSYLNAYPQGRYAGTARSLLQSIRDRNAADGRKRLDALNAKKEQDAVETAKYQQAADERGVREALSGYRQAYENKNIDQLRRVWPSMTGQEANNTQQSFHVASAIHMTLQEKSLRVSGDTAQADCMQTMQIAAGGAKQTVTNSATFFLQKRAGSWVVEKVAYGKPR